MSYTIANVEEELSGMLKGTTTNKIPNILAILKRAGRELIADIDIAETKRTQQLTNALYDSVYDYTVPTDLKGNKIIDLRPQVSRVIGDSLRSTYNEWFDQYKTSTNNMFNITHNNGTKFIRIDKNIKAGVVINQCDSLTSNGTWSAGGDGDNLTLDQNNYMTGGASLNFDVDGSGTTAYLENSDMTAVDLSDEEDIASIFLWVYLPSASAITSVDLRFGSSSSAYWNVTVTTPNFGAFQTGWNLLRFNWNGATETGSPDSEAINYLRVTWTYDGTADTDLRLDNVVARTGEIWEMVYYSKYLYTDGTTSLFKEDPEDDDDTLNLDTDSFSLYLWKVAELAAQTVKKLNNDVSYFKGEYDKGVSKYKESNKSEWKKTQNIYYKV